MKTPRPFPRRAFAAALCLAMAPVSPARESDSPAAPAPGGFPPAPTALLEGFRARTVAAVSDAVDKVTGQAGFMTHEMRPLRPLQTNMVGQAVTTVFRPSLHAASPSALRPALETIDGGAPGSLLVVVVEGDLRMTGIGGLMATACKARDFAGAVIDGAARDVDEINRLPLTVFSRSICPATVVNRMVAVGRNVPVRCGGVAVRPGDILVGGNDGVVVVPLEAAEEVLKIASEIDAREAKMVPLIRENRSILKAVEQFNRL